VYSGLERLKARDRFRKGAKRAAGSFPCSSPHIRCLSGEFIRHHILLTFHQGLSQSGSKSLRNAIAERLDAPDRLFCSLCQLNVDNHVFSYLFQEKIR
jgi:hypothetical protein